MPLERQYAYMCVHFGILFQIYSKFIGSTLNHYLAKIVFQTYYSKKISPVGQMTPGITFEATPYPECLTSLLEPIKQFCEATSSTPFLPLSTLQPRFQPPAVTETLRKPRQSRSLASHGCSGWYTRSRSLTSHGSSGHGCSHWYTRSRSLPSHGASGW